MSRARLLEDTMADEVKALYYNTMQNNIQFHQKPYLDRDWFKRHYTTVAHRHGIFHREGPEGRAQYNLFFGLVWTRLSAAIKRLAKNEAARHPPMVANRQPQQLTIPLPPAPPPESFRRWLDDFRSRQGEATK